MKTIEIPKDLYRGSGWAVASIVNEVIIDLKYLTDDLAVSIQVKRFIENEMNSTDAAINNLMDSLKTAPDSKQNEVESESIELGMCSGTMFNCSFTNDEVKEAKIYTRWMPAKHLKAK